MFESIPSWLWIVFTLAAAAAQTARNSMQRGLIKELGATGAAHVRFLYGLPFSLLFLAVMVALVGPTPLGWSLEFFAWLVLGALSQIVATAWMLMMMQARSFVVTTAVIKTEPVQVALFAVVFLGEHLGFWTWIAIITATVGVLMMSWPRGDGEHSSAGSALMLGIAAGGLFALSAVGFRGAILSLGADAPFYIRATSTLALGLLLQSVSLSLWLFWRQPGGLTKIFNAWRPSVIAGFMGALGSQMWFLAFAVESVARVRTLALVEILFAQAVSRRLFAQHTNKLELFGIFCIVGGVIVLLNS